MLEYVLENLWTSTSYLFHSYIFMILCMVMIYDWSSIFTWQSLKRYLKNPWTRHKYRPVASRTPRLSDVHSTLWLCSGSTHRLGLGNHGYTLFSGKCHFFGEWHDEAWSLPHHILYSPVTSHPFDIEITVLYWSFKTWIHIQRWILRIHSEHMICDYIWCQVRRVLTAFYQLWIHLGEVCWQFGRHKLPKFPANPPLVHPISPNGLLVVLWTSRDIRDRKSVV